MSSSGTDKIVANVYLDPRSKKNPTKMVVIRPHTTSVVRFLSQRFVINPVNLEISNFSSDVLLSFFTITTLSKLIL